MADLRTKLHIIALLSLATALALLILLSVSNISDSRNGALELGMAAFNGASPTKLVDRKTGETVVAEGLSRIRYGLWNYCWELLDGSGFTCSKSGEYTPLGYSHTIYRTDQFPISFTVRAGFTRASVLHPITSVLAFITLLSILLKRTAFKWYTAILVTLTVMMVVATFAVDIAFMVNIAQGLRDNASLNGYLFVDAGLLLMIIPTIASNIACIAIWFGHWKEHCATLAERAEYPFVPPSATAVDKKASSAYGPWWKRFQWTNGSAVQGDADQRSERSV
ncbi:hypothetical protein BDY19DRAFT_1007191 [Irpex rosettiformis]|uniref:Uncharacterized protein n=1 Tax=Irpex rosettiformis TaxID=378272 RepID=A0ACB8U2J3_9APHY|nr:hypothetical protein BDY19DRAFT_1007191 [Irpex rosettiformis]